MKMFLAKPKKLVYRSMAASTTAGTLSALRRTRARGNEPVSSSRSLASETFLPFRVSM
jgi:hypothetical protein